MKYLRTQFEENGKSANYANLVFGFTLTHERSELAKFPKTVRITVAGSHLTIVFDGTS